jgi:SAM-dependent methyltransferase
MHKTAEENVRRFFDTYVSTISNCTILEIGSYIGGFNIRSLASTTVKYIGLDIRSGPGVDLITQEEHKIPLADNSCDFIISSSCFEHTKFFWILLLDIIRVLKPHGLFYLNAPSNGKFHQYPIDAWRFFPDSGLVLSEWAKHNKYENCEVLERYTSNNKNDIWSDYVSVFIKDVNFHKMYPKRIVDRFSDFTNGSVYPHSSLINKDRW